MSMNEHQFTFLVSGVDPHSDDFADRFYEAGCDDATLMLTHGFVAVCFAREADNFAQAVVSAYRDVLKAGAVVERFEPDYLVSKAEIAHRAKLSRSVVSLYVTGERGIDFPRPRARVTSSSPLWDWVEVSSWLHKRDVLPSEIVVNARLARTVNWLVQRERPVPAPEKALLRKMESIAREPVLELA